jgi:hypothetical protein
VVVGFVVFVVARGGSPGAPIGAYTKSGAYSFVTEPTLHPPKLRADAPILTSQLAPGYILTANFYNLNYPPLVGQSGPLILDSHLRPVWFKPVPEDLVASNLSLQTYEGKPALAWWQGLVTNTGATESGEDIVVNRHYQTVARLRGKDGWKITLHALVIDGEDAWVTANMDIARNLSAYGGAYNGALIDSAVQEYNIKTGKLLRTWDALDHIPLGDSYASVPTNGFPWDAYHVNAVELDGGGKFLVSMRNTWAAYMVDVDTGAVQWTLGGKHSSFKFGPGAAFQWQHDVVLGVGGSGAGGSTDFTITMFDDHCCQLTGGGTSVPATGPSRGLVLNVDETTRTATLAAQYNGSDEFESEYMGDTQPLGNRNTFIGWGSEPYFSEYSPSGRKLLEANFPGADLSYRETLAQWVGVPLTPPRGAVRQRHGGAVVYASWNGATQLASWRVLAAAGSGRLAPVASARKTGFETAIRVPAGESSFEVQALAANGKVIGTSKPFPGSTR